MFIWNFRNSWVNESGIYTIKVSFDKKVLIKGKEESQLIFAARESFYKFINAVYIYWIWCIVSKCPFAAYIIKDLISVIYGRIYRILLLFSIIAFYNLMVD